MKRIAAFAVILALLSTALAAVGSRNAQYVGGTIAGLKEKAEGTLDVSAEADMLFRANKQPELRIPYAKVTELEYGQKAGRRIAVAVLISPLALFSKKRNHYLTVTYDDAHGKEQAAVFELGKDIVRTTLKVMETRSGKDIQYQDEDARKSGVGGK